MFCRFSRTTAIVLVSSVALCTLQRQVIAAEARPAAVRAAVSLHDVFDPGFARYVDYGLLLKAYAGMNPELLTDVGLQLAEGERILLRPHKAFPADAILNLAVKAAVEKKDKGTLDRLAKVAEKRDSAALKSQVAAAQKLGGQSRAIDPALLVSLDEMTPAQFLVYQELVRELRRARILGDRETMERLAKQATAATALPDKKRDYLAKAASDGLAAMPKEQVANPVTSTLDKLLAQSRAVRRPRPGPSFRPARPPFGGQQTIGRRPHTGPPVVTRPKPNYQPANVQPTTGYVSNPGYTPQPNPQPVNGYQATTGYVSNPGYSSGGTPLSITINGSFQSSNTGYPNGGGGGGQDAGYQANSGDSGSPTVATATDSSATNSSGTDSSTTDSSATNNSVTDTSSGTDNGGGQMASTDGGSDQSGTDQDNGTPDASQDGGTDQSDAGQ
jgi:hypothetical protein